MAASEKTLQLQLDETTSVSALSLVPSRPEALYVFAHGAGAGMRHPFMASFAAELAARGVASLRYQFPYMERGSKRPDPATVCKATVRAAVAQAAAHLPGVALFAGGKSFGGRMTSEAQADAALPTLRGVLFVGFPLHAAGAPAVARAAHLSRIDCPMLFLQGTRDKLADPVLIAQVIERLGARATLKFVDEADHSFHVPARSGRRDPEVMRDLAEWSVAWMRSVTGTG